MLNTFAPSSPFYEAVDAGSGAGSGQGAGSGAAGSGSQGAGAGAGGGGSGGATPFTLSDDAMVIPPGQKDPVKWGDYSKQYVPASSVQAEQAKFAKNFIENLAKVTGKGKQPQQQQRQQQTQRTDPFEHVRGLPLIDGQTLAALGERIQKEGIGPLYEWAGQINTILEQVGKRLQQTERGVGSFVEHRSRGEFEGKMQAAAGKLAQEMFPGVDITKHPVIHDFVQDVYLSYDPNDPTLETEFPGLLKARIDGILKLANDLNQAKLQTARDQRRQFLRPGGQGQPSGNGRGDRLSHSQIAANLFANDAART